MRKRSVYQICIALALGAVACISQPRPAEAFWLLGFSGAKTLPKHAVGIIAGTGAQITAVGKDKKTSFTGSIPHAGIRVGLGKRIDIGYRLTQVALPFSSVGPSLGSEVDLKYRVTNALSKTQVALVGGYAYSYLELLGQAKTAVSPGFDIVFSRPLSVKNDIFTELRTVSTSIPTAPGGTSANSFTAYGVGTGIRYTLTKEASIVPEIGYFRIVGKLAGESADGLALQAGAVIAIRLK